jgi:integrase
MLAVYRGHIENYIDPRPKRVLAGSRRVPFESGIGELKLAQLTPGGVGLFRDRLRTAGLSVQTTRKVLSTLQVLLEFGRTSDLLANNPARGIQVIGRRDERARRIQPPTKDTLKALLKSADDDFRVIIMFAAATGARAGELHALRWRSVDLVVGEVTFSTRVDAFGVEDGQGAKTAAGNRTVPLGASVVVALKSWRLRSSFSADDDLVFPNRRGGYDSHDNMIKRRFMPLLDDGRGAPGKLVGVTWHALRHFAISTWIDAGLSPKTVQTFAGHSSLAVTMDRYGHLFPSDDHKAAMDDIAKGLFGH